MVRLTGIDLCCGVGGLSLGFERAGFTLVSAVDSEELHARLHHANFPGCKIKVGMLSEVDPEFLISDVSGQRRKIDVVFGGPPCQGFSLMGKRVKDDPRSSVLLDFARLAVSLQPKVIVAENVKGLSIGYGLEYLAQYTELLVAAGFTVMAPWHLDAVDYGVPQRRKRMFLVAHRADMSSPRVPRTASARPTVWDAIADLAVLDERSDKLAAVYEGALPDCSEYASTLRNTASVREGQERHRLTGCQFSNHSSETIRRFDSTKPGGQESVSRFFRLPTNGPSNTLRAGTGADRGSFMAARPIHPLKPRCITVRGAARLHSFPDSFQFHSTRWHGFRQVGNSVPPLLAQAVAESIAQCLKINR